MSDLLATIGRRALSTRGLVRAPIWIYRARLGILLGRRLLMLEHTGRITHQRRQVVLEVIDRPARDQVVVVSGFGTRAQWFRNLQADPRARVWIASAPPRVAVARVLTHDEASAALGRYELAHPRSWRALKPVLENTLGHKITSDGTDLPMLALTFDV